MDQNYTDSKVYSLGDIEECGAALERLIESRVSERTQALRSIIGQIHVALGEAPESDNSELPRIIGELFKTASHRSDLLDTETKRTKRLREALEFYAKIGSASEARRLFVQDGGAIARRALESE